MSSRPSAICLLAALLLIGGLAVACGDGQRGPTAPENEAAPAAKSMSHGPGATQGGQPAPAAKSGSAEGEGTAALTLELHPEVWSTTFATSKGNVEAVVRGNGTADIDLASIKLAGDGGAAPLAPAAAKREGKYVVAQFKQADAFKLLADPLPGDTKTLTLTFLLKGKAQQLTASVRIVSPDGGGHHHGADKVRLQIVPDDWNTNWPHSKGTVAAILRGGSVKDVDLRSIRLIGDDPKAAPLAPAEVRRDGDHVLARFGKADAFATLKSPKAGESHEVTVRFDLKGKSTDLKQAVEIEGPGD
jgi:hypothetical protein